MRFRAYKRRFGEAWYSRLWMLNWHTYEECITVVTLEGTAGDHPSCINRTGEREKEIRLAGA